VDERGVAAQVTPPSVQAPSIPEVPDTPVPTGPVGDAVDGVRDGVNNTVSPPSPGGAGGGASSGGGGGAGGNSGNDGGTGASGGNGGGSGSPTARGGGSSGGSSGGDRSGSGSGGGGDRGADRRDGGRGGDRARGVAARGGDGGRDNGGSGSGSGGSDSGDKPEARSTNPVAQVIREIEKVIPAPIWAVIGVLALLALGFAVRSRLMGSRARRLERQREELLGDVGLLQRALLPDVPTSLRGIDVSVAYRPAEGPAAGGDFYDVFELDGHRTAIIVGDVCGHGRQALAVTALMRYTLRAYLGAGFEPRLALQVAGRTIEADPDGELTTVVLAIYDARAGTLTYACAGHEPPIILGAAAHEPVTIGSSPPLGGFMATGHRQTTVALPPGSSACFFTDGLVEARLGENMIGRGRLTELLSELAPEEGAQLLLERLAAQADRAPDDMAACMVRTHADAVDARSVRVEELEADADELSGERVADFLRACGLSDAKAAETVRAARARASEFGGVLLLVHAEGEGGRVEVRPVEPARMPVPALAADARRRAELQVSA
jgi:hypothetical protein